MPELDNFGLLKREIETRLIGVSAELAGENDIYKMKQHQGAVRGLEVLKRIAEDIETGEYQKQQAQDEKENP